MKREWFTLIELIVVITIIAILGTIALISFKDYTSDAKDSKVISDVTNIHKALSLSSVRKWVVPLPEDSKNITKGGKVISYQGSIWNTIKNNLKISKDAVTPEGVDYSYIVNWSQRYFEVEGKLTKFPDNVTSVKDVAGETKFYKWNEVLASYNSSSDFIAGDLDSLDFSWNNVLVWDKEITSKDDVPTEIIENKKYPSSWKAEDSAESWEGTPPASNTCTLKTIPTSTQFTSPWIMHNVAYNDWIILGSDKSTLYVKYSNDEWQTFSSQKRDWGSNTWYDLTKDWNTAYFLSSNSINKSIDGWLTWTEVKYASMHAVTIAGKWTNYVVSSEVWYNYYYTEDGDNFVSVTNPITWTSWSFTRVAGDWVNFVAIGDRSDKSAYSEDGWKTWTTITLPVSLWYYSKIDWSWKNYVVVNRDSDKFVVTNDGWKTWSLVDSWLTYGENAPWDVAYTEWVFLSWKYSAKTYWWTEEFVYSKDNGQTWKKLESPTKKAIISIWPWDWKFVVMPNSSWWQGIIFDFCE